MNRALAIRTWQEPFPTCAGVAVVFDIFRCSTTVHCLAARGEGPLFVGPSLREAARDERTRGMRVFSELSTSLECFARFDNSPFEATRQDWPSGHPTLVATTTGTPAMFAARAFEKVYVGSLSNFSALVAALSAYPGAVTLIPAALPGGTQVEDEIACQAVATALEGFSNIPEFVRQCGENAVERILASPRPAELRGKLPFGAGDVELGLALDRTPQVLALKFDETLLARVEKEPCAIG